LALSDTPEANGFSGKVNQQDACRIAVGAVTGFGLEGQQIRLVVGMMTAHDRYYIPDYIPPPVSQAIAEEPIGVVDPSEPFFHSRVVGGCSRF